MKKIFITSLISICIIGVFYTTPTFAINIEKTRTQIDSQMGTLIKIIGYTIVFVCAVKEILQQLQNGDIQAIWGIFVKYLVIYGALLAIPVGLKWVETFIEGLSNV